MKRTFCLIFTVFLCLTFFASCKKNSETDVIIETTSETMNNTEPVTEEVTTEQPKTEAPTESAKKTERTSKTEKNKNGETIPPISEADAVSFVTKLYERYDIESVKVWNGVKTATKDLFFPTKNSGVYVLPIYLDEYLYQSGTEINLAKDDTSWILTEEEEKYLETYFNENLYFSVCKLTDLQKTIDDIYGEGFYTFGGKIENMYTESGYFLMEVGRGGDSSYSLESYKFSSYTPDKDSVSVTVTENWKEYDWTNDSFDRYTSTTTYILALNGSSVYLKDLTLE